MCVKIQTQYRSESKQINTEKLVDRESEIPPLQLFGVSFHMLRRLHSADSVASFLLYRLPSKSLWTESTTTKYANCNSIEDSWLNDV